VGVEVDVTVGVKDVLALGVAVLEGVKDAVLESLSVTVGVGVDVDVTVGVKDRVGVGVPV